MSHAVTGRGGTVKHYVFLTMEGYTFQPGSEATEPDIENVQMLGVASGSHQRAAFRRLLTESPWLRETSFDEVYCYELARNYSASRTEFSLKAEYQSARTDLCG